MPLFLLKTLLTTGKLLEQERREERREKRRGFVVILIKIIIVKRFTLKGCAIDLGRYLETQFTNIGFEETSHTAHFHSPLRAYISSTSGLVFQINLDDLFVEAVSFFIIS